MDYKFGILLKQRKFCEIGYLYFQLQIGTGPVIGVWWYLVNCELRGLRFVTLGEPPGGCLGLNFISEIVHLLRCSPPNRSLLNSLTFQTFLWQPVKFLKTDPI